MAGQDYPRLGHVPLPEIAGLMIRAYDQSFYREIIPVLYFIDPISYKMSGKADLGSFKGDEKSLISWETIGGNIFSSLIGWMQDRWRRSWQKRFESRLSEVGCVNVLGPGENQLIWNDQFVRAISPFVEMRGLKMRQMMNDICVGVFPLIWLVCLNYKNFDSMKATDCLDFFELKGVNL